MTRHPEVRAKRASKGGGPITYLDPQEAQKADEVSRQVHGRAWDLWKRKVLADMKK